MPTTRRQLKMSVWQRLRLPTELVELIVTEIVGDALHTLFTHDRPLQTRRQRTSPNPIRTLLSLSHQYRAVTAQMLVRLFYIEDHNEKTSPSEYQVLCRSVARMHALANLYKDIRSKTAEPGVCRQRALEQDPSLLSRPFARVYYRVNSRESFLDLQEDGNFLTWSHTHPSGAVAENSVTAGDKTTSDSQGNKGNNSAYCDAITWRGFQRLADDTHEMLLVMSLNLLARIYRCGFGGTKSFGPRENYAATAIPLFKPLLMEMESRWREVAVKNHFDLAPNPKQLRCIPPSLISTSEIGPTLGVLDWLGTASRGSAPEINKLTALLDDVQIAFDLGGPPGALKNQILQIVNS